MMTEVSYNFLQVHTVTFGSLAINKNKTACILQKHIVLVLLCMNVHIEYGSFA